MVLTPQQIKALKDLHADMGEVMVMTTGRTWEEAKDQVAGLTFGMVLEWSNVIASILQADNR